MCNPEIKLDPNFTTLPILLSTLLETYPRDIGVVKQAIALLVDYIREQKGIISQLTTPTSPIISFCNNSLQDDTCPLAIQFSVCSFFVVFPHSREQTPQSLARLVLKCIHRAKTENQEIPEYVILGIEGLTFNCSIDKLVKDPTDELSPPPSLLTYSEFQELLGIALAHSNHNVLLMREIGMLSRLSQKYRDLLYTTVLLRGLRHAFVFFHRCGDKDAMHFILRIVYELNKSNKKQAEAMADSEIVSGITEGLHANVRILKLSNVRIMDVVTCQNGLL